jgi:hypothetical protein
MGWLARLIDRILGTPTPNPPRPPRPRYQDRPAPEAIGPLNDARPGFILAWSPQLAAAALEQARRNAAMGRMAHSVDLAALVYKHTPLIQPLGECVAEGQTTPAEVMDAWINERFPHPHRDILLSPGARYVGVAVAYGPNDGRPYWCAITGR